jgi:TRAP-type C4-dicarboxylate transport system substrate-binding protein
MERRTLLRLGAASALALAAQASTALAQQRMVLKATDVHPLGYPTVEAVVHMG